MMITVGQVSAAAAVLAAVVGLATLIRTVREYVLQGTQKRSEAFFALRKRLDDDARLVELLRFAQDDDPRLASTSEVSYQEKYELLGYFEEVALMMNSRLVRPCVAWYMFGYYALRIFQSKNYWSNICRTDLYWWVFNDFAEKMARYEEEEFRRMSKRGRSRVASHRRMRF